VERWIGCAEAFDARSDYGNGLLDRVAEMLRALAKESAELSGALDAVIEGRDAAFTASDAYQKRCEQGDALLREARDALEAGLESDGDLEPDWSRMDREMVARIDAHLAGEDMGRGK
jgi:hypothetical protein